MTRPLIAVVADTRQFEGYLWHAAPDQYLRAVLDVARVTPLVVPAFGGQLDIQGVLAAVDGLLLTGSRSNVHPEHYGLPAGDGGGPYDPARDETSIAMAKAALAADLPLLAICRGMQELNVALGGSLEGELQERPGRLDHRAPQSESADDRFALRQPVELCEGGCLAGLLGTSAIEVNSLHRQGVGQLAPRLKVDARAPDGVIEAVTVRDAQGFALGVQWHPEYWAGSDPHSARIFEAFGAAVREHRAARGRAAAAA